MSNLKHQTVGQLYESLLECEACIRRLETQLRGQRKLKQWIEKYIFEKTPQELTIEQIEQKLGHKIIIK